MGMRAAALLTVCVVLTACGGGGGAGSAEPIAEGGGAPVSTGIDISGTVVKGPVRGAAVTAHCHDTAPAATIGSATTNDQAAYTLRTTRACNALLELRASGGSYVDEATGQTLQAPAQPWLRALADGAGTATQRTLHVTALTEAIYAAATVNGSTAPSATSLAAAESALRSRIEQNVVTADFDFATTRPATPSGTASGDAAIAYALLLAAVSDASGGSAENVANVVQALNADGGSLATSLTHVVASSEVLARLGVSAEVARSATKNLVVATLPAKAMVSAGSGHTLALASDGSVWSWGGGNDVGALGDGTTVNRTAPVRVANLSNVVAIAAGGDFSIALRADGTAWAWGKNISGQLGSARQQQYTPVQVPGLSTVQAIAAGSNHGLALKADGTVWAWGQNDFGQLGVPGTGAASGVDYRYAPQPVSGLSGVIRIAAGFRHSLALHADGTVSAWGGNVDGQLGDGTLINSHTPGKVPGLQGVAGISAGWNSSTAAKTDGTVVSWGNGAYGTFGSGQFGQYFVKAPVVASGLTNVGQAAINENAAVTLRKDGTVATSGSNYFGQLGDGQFGDSSSRNTFATVTGLSRIVQVSMGNQHVVGIDADGNVWTWGSNHEGRLGRGSTATTSGGTPLSASPAKLAGLNLGGTAFTPSGGNDGGSSTSSLNYDQLANKLTREFTGKDFQVRQCTDRVDALYPNGVGSDTEPYWPPPYVANINTGIGCSINFGLEEYSVAYVNLDGCAAAYAASDYEAVGRRGYSAYMVPARDNLSKYYNLRRSKDPQTLDLVCKGP